MKPRSQLCFANLLMTVGALPWLLMVAWLIAFFLRGGAGRVAAPTGSAGRIQPPE
jgi:hypothetical protein